MADSTGVSEDVIYISNTGKRLYSKYEYYLDVIETNLNCYKDDFFMNDDDFGVEGVALSNTDAVKDLVSGIITNRLSGEGISVSNVDTDGTSIVITLTGSAFEGTIELEEAEGVIHVSSIES